jgi:hypothetical protein
LIDEDSTVMSPYIIKHIYLPAPSLLRPHVYVSLFSYKISPEFYNDHEEEEEDEAKDGTAVNHYLNHTVEYFEQENRDCSCGEQY